MTKPGKQAEESTGELKRLSDYVQKGGSSLEGDKIEVEKILGEEIILVDFVFLKGSEKFGGGEFAVIQFKQNDTVYTTSTGAKVVVEALKEMPKQYLPVKVKLIRKLSKEGGRKYLSFE